MRLNYSDDEDWTGQFALWEANCRRSLRGRAGQRELRELEAALLALPEKQLIHGSLTDDDGGMCAIACYAKHKGVDLSAFDPGRASDKVGIAGGMPRLVAWRVVAENDYDLASRTPRERYDAMLEWVREQLRSTAD